MQTTLKEMKGSEEPLLKEGAQLRRSARIPAPPITPISSNPPMSPRQSSSRKKATGSSSYEKLTMIQRSKLDWSALNHYVYRSVDYSLISRFILRHYWDYVIRLFPIWMAPNLITLLGFACIVMNFLITLYAIPDLIQVTSGWVYIM
jgi:hypothetical protein